MEKKTFKKLAAMILSLCMIVGSAGALPIRVSAESTTRKIANVVIFVDFADTSHAGHNPGSKTGKCPVLHPEYVREVYDGDAAHPTALKQYLHTISYGQLEVVNIFPQLGSDGKTLTPYKLNKNADQYSNASVDQIIEEVAANWNGTLSAEADQDKDGEIDNLTIVVPCRNDGGSNPDFSGFKSSCQKKVTIGSYEVADYNLLPEYGAFLTGEAGMVIHEFLHTVGYPDLYRGGRSGMPVGRWDIMAAEGSFVQYPLAYLRSGITKWFGMNTVTASQKGCSLYAASKTTADTKDKQALILKTPYSDSEFFVVEYRKQDDLSKPGCESQVPGSGLIVYRVVPSLYDNRTGSRDMIYVFRTGDSYGSDGRENALTIDSSWLSSESKRTSFGSTDPKASLAENAIVYSDGTNSGIVISNVGSNTGDQITFDLTFADFSNEDYWTTVTEHSEYTYRMEDSFMDTDGSLYVLRNDNQSTRLYKYNQGGWSQCSNNLSEITSDLRLEKYNGKLYAAGRGTNGLKLYRLDGSVWTHVDTISKPFSYFDMESGGDGLYLVHNNDGAAPNQLSVYQYGSSGSVMLGSQVSGGEVANSPSIAAENGRVAVMYRSSGNQLRVKYYDAGTKTWKQAGNLSVTADSGIIRMHKGMIYLLRNSGSNANEMYIYDLTRSDSVWKKVGDNFCAGESVAYTDICFHGDAPHIVYFGNSSKELRVVNLTNHKWTALGKKAASGAYLEAGVHSYGGNIYVAYKGENNHIFIKSRLSNNKSAVPEANTSGGSGGGSGDTSTGDNTTGGGNTGGNTTGGGNTGGNTTGSGNTGTNNPSGGSNNDNPGNSGSISNGTVSGGDSGGSSDVVNTSGIGNLTVTMTKCTALRLSWSPVAGAKNYEIYYSTSPNSGFRRLASSKKTIYNFSKAKCGQTYYFKVRAGKKVGKKVTYGDFCPAVSGRTVLDGTVNAYIAKSTYQSATIKWNKIKGAKKYEIYYSTSPSGGYQLLKTQGGSSFTHKGLQAGVTYYYKVRPVRDLYYGAYSDETSVRVVLSSLTKLKVQSSGPDRLKVSWKKVPGADRYIILRSDSENGTYRQVGVTNKTSYLDTGLAPSTAYDYKVYAVSGSYQTNTAGPVRQVTGTASH